ELSRDGTIARADWWLSTNRNTGFPLPRRPRSLRQILPLASTSPLLSAPSLPLVLLAFANRSQIATRVRPRSSTPQAHPGFKSITMPVELRKRKAPQPPPAPAPVAKKASKPAAAAKPANKAKKAEAPKKAAPKAEEKKAPKTEEKKAPEAEKKAVAAGKAGAVAVGHVVDLDGFGGEVETNDGEKTSLKKLVEESGSGVVLFTYPKASTPGCTNQVCLFRDAYEPLTADGLAIYGLSSDSPKANTTFREKQKLPYPLLCDPAATLIAAIGLKKQPKGTQRGVFVVDKEGRVLVAEPGGPAATVERVKALVEELNK
ncbi:Peroxiredoxin DOT5, partial [Tolypocladium ophioglossoides CBS 100239]